jgi:hypothetical protein
MVASLFSENYFDGNRAQLPVLSNGAARISLYENGEPLTANSV